MLTQIIQNTPTYVFAIFAALLWMGSSQLFRRTVSLRRLSIMALAMTGFSLWGTVSAFHAQPLALLAWAAAAGAVFAFIFFRPVPAGTRYDAWQQRFTLPGSAVPLALMMGIFATKYVVGVAMAMNPGLAGHLDFAIGASLLYGAFSGTFVARSARLARLAMQAERDGLSMVAV